MIKSRMFVSGGVLLASFGLLLGLIGWLQAARPGQVAQAVGLIDDSFTDFSGGSGCYVRASGVGGLDGEVIMTPTVDTDFPGSSLPAEWLTTPGTVVTVTGGLMMVDQGVVYTSTAGGPNRTLEFSATFTGPHAQFIGFSDNTDFTNIFAIFGTTSADDGHLYARTSGQSNIDLGTGLFDVVHRFRIEWGTSVITYTIYTDTLGTSAEYAQSVTLAGSMAPMFLDNNSSGVSLTVDWARLWPWTCVFTSRVIDSGYVGFAFTGISTTLNLPAGTSIGFEARTSGDGNTFGAWTPVNADGTFSAGLGQFMQYRAALYSPVALNTPEAQVVQAHGLMPNAVRLTSFAATGSDFAVRGLLIGVGSIVLVMGGARVLARRRKKIA